MSKFPQIPGYQVIKKLGQGGMADVFLGIQQKLQRQVAIKVMIPSLFRDEQFAKRFIKEAQTAAQLNHPNIITIHDVGEAEDIHYIVMEYLEETLSDRLKALKSIPLQEALKIVKMIASALDYAHGKGFIHRDIKPDNIMFRADETVVLVDFGIARAMDSSTHLTRTGMSIGTPHYMSPEQCKGEKIDGRSDIYSLGIQFYEMLTGEVPYKAENTAGIIIKQIQDPVPQLPKTFQDYQILLEKMMAKDRDERAQSGSELIHMIDSFLSTRYLTPPPATIPEGTITLNQSGQQSFPSAFTGQKPTVLHKPRKKKLLIAFVSVAVALLMAIFYFVFIEFLKDNSENNKETPSVVSDKQDLISENTKTITDPNVSPPEEEKKISSPPDLAIEKKGDVEQPLEKEVIPEKEPPIEEGKTPEEKNQTQKKEPLQEKKPPQQTKIKNTPTEEVKEQNIKPIKTDEIGSKIKETPSTKKTTPIETVTLLDIDPETQQIYNKLLHQVKIPIVPQRLQVHGQITVQLLVNERGNIQILSFDEKLNVNPAGRKFKVIAIIKRWVMTKSLPAPKDKNKNPVKFNWRLTFKVGKYFNKIILTKQ